MAQRVSRGRKQTKVWITKDKRRIRICDMDDSHLVNTIRMLDRKYEVIKGMRMSLGEEMLCMLQGEMAIDSVEGDLRVLEQSTPADWIPVYDNLLLEAERRELVIEHS